MLLRGRTIHCNEFTHVSSMAEMVLLDSFIIMPACPLCLCIPDSGNRGSGSIDILGEVFKQTEHLACACGGIKSVYFLRTEQKTM